MTTGMDRLIAEAAIELIPMGSLERAVSELRPNTTVSMTCSPAKTIEATLDESARLRAARHDVTPHISARMVADADHLAAIRERLRAIGLRKIFVVAGDAEQPGAYFDAIEFISALLELDDRNGAEQRQIDHIGFTAYPDTHPFITNAQLHDALHRKQDLILPTGRTAHVSTQMCFAPELIEAWLRRERDAGLSVPVHLGVPGAIDTAKLLTTGMRLGVGASLRYLRKNKAAVGNLVRHRSFTPDAVLDPLVPYVDELGIGGVHLFTFNQVLATEAWRDARSRQPASAPR